MEEFTDKQKVLLETKRAELVELLEAFSMLEKSREWEILKKYVFSVSQASIERQVLNVSLNPKIDTDKLYQLQGEYAWARRFMDTDRFIESLKQQLQTIKEKLQ